MKIQKEENQKQIYGKEYSPILIQIKTNSLEPLQQNHLHLINTDYMIWQEMFGNGVAIGTLLNITKNCMVARQIIQRDPLKVMIQWNQLFLKEWLEEVLFYVMLLTAKDIE